MNVNFWLQNCKNLSSYGIQDSALISIPIQFHRRNLKSSYLTWSHPRQFLPRLIDQLALLHLGQLKMPTIYWTNGHIMSRIWCLFLIKPLILSRKSKWFISSLILRLEISTPDNVYFRLSKLKLYCKEWCDKE